MSEPTYCKQKTPRGDYAYTRVNGERFHLGKGNSPESFEKFAGILKAWESTGRAPVSKKTVVTVRTLVDDYLAKEVPKRYKKNGRDTSSVARINAAIKLLLQDYGDVSTDDFDCGLLSELQEKLIDARQRETNFLRRRLGLMYADESKPVSLSTDTVNTYISIIKRIFKWGVPRKLTSDQTCFSHTLVEDLEERVSGTVDYAEVTSVPDEWVEKTRAFLTSAEDAMVRLQGLTGMRPGEVQNMRLCDIDTSDDVWIYVPWEHRTEHHGKPRIIGLGWQCQVILQSYIWQREEQPESWFFSPREMNREIKDRRYWSKKDKYDDQLYRNRIKSAAEKARVPHWFPNQLRHTALTAIRAREGLEAAQIMANHNAVFHQKNA